MTQDKQESYLKKLINGDISLLITYWVWFVFISLLLNTFTDFNFSNYDETQRIKSDIYFALSFYFLTLIYTIFIFIAVIRSANKYKGSKLWSFIAKVIITINLFTSLYTALEITKVYLLEDYAIENEISVYREKLPIDVNSYTQLFDISKKEKDILYIYKLKHIDINKDINFNKKRFSKRVQESLCEDDGTVELLKKDYILKYTYLDINDTEITKVSTDKTACGKSIYDLDILRQVLKAQGQI